MPQESLQVRAPFPASAEVVAPRIVPKAVEQPQRSSVLGATLRFKGELRSDEDFVFQGQIEGSIHHSQNLTIGTDGVVKGDSRARTIVVEGTVEGDLYALEYIDVRATAKVLGNLFAPRVAIADGANFNGRVDMASAARAARSIVERQSVVPPDERLTDQLLETKTTRTPMATAETTQPFVAAS